MKDRTFSSSSLSNRQSKMDFTNALIHQAFLKIEIFKSHFFELRAFLVSNLSSRGRYSCSLSLKSSSDLLKVVTALDCFAQPR